jgi:hypothetical protein
MFNQDEKQRRKEKEKEDKIALIENRTRISTV